MTVEMMYRKIARALRETDSEGKLSSKYRNNYTSFQDYTSFDSQYNVFTFFFRTTSKILFLCFYNQSGSIDLISLTILDWLCYLWWWI